MNILWLSRNTGSISYSSFLRNFQDFKLVIFVFTFVFFFVNTSYSGYTIFAIYNSDEKLVREVAYKLYSKLFFYREIFCLGRQRLQSDSRLVQEWFLIP